MFSLSWQGGSLQHYFKTHYWCKSLVEHFWYTSLACFALFSLWSIFSGQKQNAHKNQNATFPGNYKRAQAIWMMFWKSNSPFQQIWKTAHCHLRNDTLARQLNFDGDTMFHYWQIFTAMKRKDDQQNPWCSNVTWCLTSGAVQGKVDQQRNTENQFTSDAL